MTPALTGESIDQIPEENPLDERADRTRVASASPRAFRDASRASATRT